MNVIFGDAAKMELVETIEWYEVQQAGLGKRFAQALDLTKKRISIFPEIVGPEKVFWANGYRAEVHFGDRKTYRECVHFGEKAGAFFH